MKNSVLLMRSLIITVLFSTVLFAGCQQKAKNQMILFVEQEEGVEPYQTRIMITPTHIRFDEGDNTGPFLLIDRNKSIAYNVNHELQTIMKLQSKSIELSPPVELKYSVNVVDDLKDAPTIKDIKPVHRQLLTNEQVCLDIISVDGLMPEAVAALKEYHLLLASDSAMTFNIMPADMHDPCAISMSTFAPTRHLEYGFPVQEWKPGYTRNLQNYDPDFQVDPELLTLPKDYFSYFIQEYREGRVDLENRKVLPITEQEVQAPAPAENESGSKPAENGG